MEAITLPGGGPVQLKVDDYVMGAFLVFILSIYIHTYYAGVMADQ
jgi:hypothetical protein